MPAAPARGARSAATAPQAVSPLLETRDEEARSDGSPRRTYGVKEQHRNSWGWKVSTYLWTKSIAAGAFLVPALLALGFAAGFIHYLLDRAAFRFSSPEVRQAARGLLQS